MEDLFRQTRVTCTSGYKADERPVTFVCEDRVWDVREVVDRWYEGGPDPVRPVVDYFKVRTAEGLVFLLRHIHDSDEWSAAPVGEDSSRS